MSNINLLHVSALGYHPQGCLRSKRYMHHLR